MRLTSTSRVKWGYWWNAEDRKRIHKTFFEKATFKYFALRCWWSRNVDVFFWNLKHQRFSAFGNRVQSSWQRVARFIFKLNNPSLIHKCINEGILAPSQCKYRLVLSSTITARGSDTLTGMPHPALDFNLGRPSHGVLLTASAGFHQAPTAGPSQFFVCFVCTRFWNYIEHISVRLPRVYVLAGFDSASALSPIPGTFKCCFLLRRFDERCALPLCTFCTKAVREGKSSALMRELNASWRGNTSVMHGTLELSWLHKHFTPTTHTPKAELKTKVRATLILRWESLSFVV